jgi:hypothetical protein
LKDEAPLFSVWACPAARHPQDVAGVHLVLRAVNRFNYGWTLVVDAYGRTECKEHTEPLDPVTEFLTKDDIGCYSTTQDYHSFPHDTGPHHALRLERLDEEQEHYEPSYNAQTQVVMLTVLGKPFEMGVPKEFGECHEQYVQYSHSLSKSAGFIFSTETRWFRTLLRGSRGLETWVEALIARPVKSSYEFFFKIHLNFESVF